jgi:NADPH-dependent 2,4-dienoyl-CoA reductase/sulfur reductase-like enzyme
MHLLIIGGSDGGIAAALRARELDPAVEVTVVVADAYPNFSICGLPYYLSGDVPDWRDLAHRTTTDLEQTGIQLRLDHTARAIEPASKQVTVTDRGMAAGGRWPMTGWWWPPGRSRSAPRSTGWTWTGCRCCTPWATPSPSTRPSLPTRARP